MSARTAILQLATAQTGAGGHFMVPGRLSTGIRSLLAPIRRFRTEKGRFATEKRHRLLEHRRFPVEKQRFAAEERRFQLEKRHRSVEKQRLWMEYQRFCVEKGRFQVEYQGFSLEKQRRAPECGGVVTSCGRCPMSRGSRSMCARAFRPACRPPALLSTAVLGQVDVRHIPA